MRQRKFFESVLEELPSPVVYLRRHSDDFSVQYMNPAAEKITALSLQEVEKSPLQTVFPDITDKACQALHRVFKEDLQATAESVHYQNWQGEYFVLRIYLSAFSEGVLLVADNLLPLSAPPQVYHPSAYDALTGILLREVFLSQASKELQAAEEREESSALLLVDLDGFKEINDVHGHSAGDQALQRSAHQISLLVRYRDLVGRLGGDEIVIFVPGADKSIASRVAERIVSTLRSPSASVGCAIAYPGCRVEDIVQLADEAMYDVKSRGGQGWQIKFVNS